MILLNINLNGQLRNSEIIESHLKYTYLMVGVSDFGTHPKNWELKSEPIKSAPRF